MKRKYTKKLHAYRVSLMVEKIESNYIGISACCPAAKGFFYANSRVCGDPLDRFQEALCRICLEFVGIAFTNPRQSCPCYALGLDEAITKTKSALKEYYK